MAIIRYPNMFGFTRPLEELARMRREMDRLFSQFAGRGPLAVDSGVFPAVNVSGDASNIYVQAELPGVKSEDLEISVEGNTLTLRGERKPDTATNVNYHRRERRAGKFHKAISLPDEINAEAVQATYKDGVLKLVLPKAEHAKPRKIAVKTE